MKDAYTQGFIDACTSRGYDAQKVAMLMSPRPKAPAPHPDAQRLLTKMDSVQPPNKMPLAKVPPESLKKVDPKIKAAPAAKPQGT